MKRILEDETKHPYVIRGPRSGSSDCSACGRLLWTVALDDDIEVGYIEAAKLTEGRLWFTSNLVFHVEFFMWARYSELSCDRRRAKLGEDFEWLHLPEIRRKHARRIPHVVRFLDRLEGQIQAANRRWGTQLEMYSGIGQVYVVFEILVNEQGDLEITILRHVRALKDVFRGMSRWLDKNEGALRNLYGPNFLVKI
ncbi:MAG TPA: hypothetical protein VLY21_01245 [Nitrososphaerales archaeon]|nr:hypothetical protein [Nitrososphaerales archaeon]